uniref:Uncharacterized protein n=1 Tax=Avena sativa TaxID=4498 RepID=A0ACD5ZKK8_AVESA
MPCKLKRREYSSPVMPAGWAPKTRGHCFHKCTGPISSNSSSKRAFTSSFSHIFKYRVLCWHVGGGILRLPTSLKYLAIKDNSWLTSLEPMSGQPLSLGDLCLVRCSALASLPNEPQAYGSLFSLEVKACPAIKKLPICLQQRLGSIYWKYLDAQYEVMTFKPKTWKEIPRLIRERKEAKRKAEQRKQANRTTEEQHAE